MIITVRRLGWQLCWSEPWTGFSARTVLTAVPHDPTGGEPERVRIVPVSVQFQHLGDDAFHGVLLGRYAGEVTQVLLALLDRVGESGASTRLCPDTTTLGFIAAIASRLSIQACRATSSV